MYQVDSVYLDFYFITQVVCTDTIHRSYIYFFFLFISHSCFIRKINNQTGSGKSFRIAPRACCVSRETNKGSTVSVIAWESPAPAQVVVGADVTASPFNWHFGPFPVRPMRMESV